MRIDGATVSSLLRAVRPVVAVRSSDRWMTTTGNRTKFPRFMDKNAEKLVEHMREEFRDSSRSEEIVAAERGEWIQIETLKSVSSGEATTTQASTTAASAAWELDGPLVYPDTLAQEVHKKCPHKDTQVRQSHENLCASNPKDTP
jgi:hypothetical protein